MRYAICYRGISYFKDYTHIAADGTKPDPYDIDFSSVIESNKKYLFDPLTERGDQYDCFFYTYDSEKLDYFIEQVNPVLVYLKPLNVSLGQCNWDHIWQINIDTMTMVYNFEQKHNIRYDYVVMTRFDNMLFEYFTKLYFPENSVSVITRQDDNFFVIDRNIFDDVYRLFINADRNVMIHWFPLMMAQNGMRCHKIYPEHMDLEKYPFYRNTRKLLTPPGHLYRQDSPEEIVKESSQYYIYHYQQNTEYSPCF